MSRLKWFLLGAASVCMAAIVAGLIAITQAHGFSAREKPMAVERWMARRARSAALPKDARARQNPIPNGAEAIADGRPHWADHCAACHANDGSGGTEIGQSLYPPAPDMRRADTQQLTDGELFYIIENGVRLSGMPAWGGDSRHGSGEDSWKLVRFIRHLPSLSPQEIKEMESLNPKSSQECEQEQQQKRVQKEGPAPSSNRGTPAHKHQH